MTLPSLQLRLTAIQHRLTELARERRALLSEEATITHTLRELHAAGSPGPSEASEAPRRERPTP
jgi:hypothetical protein